MRRAVYKTYFTRQVYIQASNSTFVYQINETKKNLSAFFLSFLGLTHTTVCFSDIPSGMRGGGVSRAVTIAYLGAGDGPVLNPLNYTSASLKRILMFCCGPRSGPTACKSGARIHTWRLVMNYKLIFPKA